VTFVNLLDILPFSHSFNKALNCYDILHLDIWGPIATSSIHGHSYFLTIDSDMKLSGPDDLWTSEAT
jgi:hypothetical protein